ncbi:MAG: Pseudouridine synthase [candidate division TM6 bacterium GW2011_GWF2_28_16]|nr:MAG: Pseudouridine synthase [candidate division TM6 bacterium GW2011_GWF2_28_16]
MKNININIEKTELITCTQEDLQHKRLDKLLFSKYPDLSRSYFQELINKNLITVNSNSKIKPSYKFKKNDLITINFPKITQYNVKAQDINFDIIDIKPDFIIVNKPAGLVVHPSDNNKDEVSLVHGLLYKFKEFNDFDDNQRPGIVHRIDRGTSGLLIVARNMKSQIKFSKMFKDRHIKKTYIAVVSGHPPKEGKIDYPIGRHPSKSHLMSHKSYNSKPALTYYKVLEYFKNESLVEIKIVTGRTHQIRVHMAAIGHGLLGDGYYGYLSKFISHPALHAFKLSFDYKCETFEYECKIPEDINFLINNLEKR